MTRAASRHALLSLVPTTPGPAEIGGARMTAGKLPESARHAMLLYTITPPPAPAVLTTPAVLTGRRALSSRHAMLLWGIAGTDSDAIAPSAPLTVVGARGNGAITWTWDAPADSGGAAIDNYRVRLYTAGGGDVPVSESTTGTGTLSLQTSGLANGVAYRATVEAHNSAGWGAASDYSAFVTPATVPDAPVIGTAVAGNSTARVSFSPPASDGGAPITSYRVTSTPDSLTGDGTDTATSITVTGLTNGVEYTFAVHAVNDVGPGAESAASNAVTPLAFGRSGGGVGPMGRFSILSRFGGSTPGVASSSGTVPEPPFQNVALTATTLSVGDRFEVVFDLASALMADVTHPRLPYDVPARPTVPSTAVGISVWMELSQDGFVTVRRQDCFYSELMQNEVDGTPIVQKGGVDWIVPSGVFRWRGWWEPRTPGSWQVRLAVQKTPDTITTSSALDFTVTANPASRGVIRVSATDVRRFEDSNGLEAPMIGYNLGTELDTHSPSEAAALMAELATSKMLMNRLQLAGFGIYGSLYGQWWNPAQPAQNEALIGIIHGAFGAFAASYPTLTPPPTDHPLGSYALWLNSDERDFGGGTTYRYNPLAVAGYNTPRIPVNRSTTYEVEVWYSEQNLEGPRVVGQPYGLGILEGSNQSQVWHATDITQRWNYPGVATVRAATWAGSTSTVADHPTYGPYLKVMTDQWTTGASQDFLTFFGPCLVNCVNTSGAGSDGTLNAGHAFIYKIMLREVLSGGNYGPNMIAQSDFNVHLTVCDARAYALDVVLDAARDEDIYVRVALHTKNDWCWLLLQDSGALYTGTTSNSTGFYGNGRETGGKTAQRWLQEQVWERYFQARYGWRSNIHSRELCNEMDNAAVAHIRADEFGKFHRYTVLGLPQGSTAQSERRQMVAPSYHSNAPTSVWNDPTYPDLCDFEDYHQYVGPTSGTLSAQIRDNSRFFDVSNDVVTFSSARGALTAGGHGKPVVRGEWGLTFPNEFLNVQGYDTVIGAGFDDGRWLHDALWASLHHGGIYVQPWGNLPWLGHQVRTISPTHNYRDEYLQFVNFLADQPRNNGRYVDLGATPTDTNVLVVGEKDTVGNAAVFWTVNKLATWATYAVTNGATLPTGNPKIWDSSRLTGTLPITGYTAGATYNVLRRQYAFDTSLISETTVQVVADGSGTVTVDLDALSASCTDCAWKISLGSASAPVVTVPSTLGFYMPGCNPARTSRITTESAPGDLIAVSALPIEPYVSVIGQPIAPKLNGGAYRVFLPTSVGLMAFDRSGVNLVHQWTYHTEHPLGHAPTFHDDVVYVGGLDRRLHAINATTGASLLTFTAGGMIATNPIVLDIDGDPIVFFGARDGVVYAIYGYGATGGTPGTVFWSTQLPEQVNYSPAYDAANGTIIVAANNTRGYALNVLTGTQVWQTAVLAGEGFQSGWAVVHPDGKVVLTRRNPSNQEFQFQTQALFPTGHTAVQGQPFSAALSTNDPVTGHVRIDARLNDVGGQSLVAYHATHNFKRRSVMIFDAATGIEERYDFRGVGAVDPMPPTSWGKTINAFPPPVDDNGLLITRSTDIFQDAAISGALFIGLRIGEPYFQFLCGPMPGANGRLPQDEPSGQVIAGPIGAQELHFIYNSSRMGGSIDLDEPNLSITSTNAARQRRFYEGAIPPASANNLPHGTKVGGAPWPTTTADSWVERIQYDQHPDSETLANFHYLDGDVPQPTIFDGFHLEVVNNALVLFGAGVAGPTTGVNAPVLTAVATPTGTPLAATTLSASVITARLEAEITKIIAQPSLKSGWYGPGLFYDSGGAVNYEAAFCDLWSNPGENVDILLRARPFLNPTLQAQLDAWMIPEFFPVTIGATPQGRVSPVFVRHTGFAVGADRFSYDISTQQTFGTLGGAHTAMYGYYGLLRWVTLNPTHALPIYNAIRNLTVTAPAVGSGNEHLTHRHNAYLAYIYAYLAIWQAAGSPSGDSKANAGGTGTLQVHQPIYEAAKIGMSVDQIWTGAQTNIGNQSYRFAVGAWPWLHLTPPLAAYLRTNDLAHTQTMFDAYTALLPYWFQVHNPEIQGENGTSLYQQAHSMFQALALVLGASQATLTKYLDTPICTVGDMYWINNAAAVLEAS